MVQGSHLLGVLFFLLQIMTWMPLDAAAQGSDAYLGWSLPDCFEGVGGGEGGGESPSPYAKIIERFTEQADRLLRDSEKRFPRCVALGSPREISPSTWTQECRFSSAKLSNGSWFRFEEGTPITGDDSGWIDHTKTWISMKDPFTGAQFPIRGVGFGFQVHTQGSADQSFESLERESSVVVYYEPLRFVATCSTDKF